MQAKEARQLSLKNASNNIAYYILLIEIEKAAKKGYYKAAYLFSDETFSSINKTISLLKQDGFEVLLYNSMNDFYVCVSW